MLRLRSSLLLLAAACLVAPGAQAQQQGYGLAPADTQPSLVPPPHAPSVGSPLSTSQSPENRIYESDDAQYRPLESYPSAYDRPASYGSSVVLSQPISSCECSPSAAVRYQPTTTLSPVTLPPAAYSSTYVPPPPTRALYGTRVVSQRPVVYPPSYATPVVYQRPVTPVAAPVSASYYLPPIVPVQNVPVGATIGRGILGQPTVYVPGQPVRNFVRYLSP